ncbi:small multi-drug export protein [Candidatus Woesearchaeota archaeon]|nr:small multi-drug export protein [Candidatus Woesearchaeota archaeon]
MELEIITTIFLSMLPISELRGAIPYGIISGLNPNMVFFIAVAANVMVIPIIFLFLDNIHHHLMHFGLYKKTINRFIERTHRKTHSHISKYGYLGLAIFVAVPLPVTGAYTGTLAAWLFGMERKKAMVAISMGVVIAGIIVTTMVLTGIGATTFLNNKLIASP